MPKVIRSGVREIVLKVKEFFLKEKKQDSPLIPFERVNERVAAATGISLRTVARISNERRLVETSSSKIVTPVKNRKIRKDKLMLDNCVLRRKIQEFYARSKEIPTVKKLHCVLKEEIGFEGSREIVRQHMKMIGFQFRKTKSNRKVQIERNNTTAWLQSIITNEEIDKLPVETYINSGLTAEKCRQKDDIDGVLDPVPEGQRSIGGEQGFVGNSSLIFISQTKCGGYHDNMNHIFKKVSEYNTSIDKAPNINSRKSEIMEWLMHHNIEFSQKYTKPQLLEVVKRIKT